MNPKEKRVLEQILRDITSVRHAGQYLKPGPTKNTIIYLAVKITKEVNSIMVNPDDVC